MESGETILANSFILNLNNFLSCTNQYIHLASEFSKSIKTLKQASKVSNKLNTKIPGRISIVCNDPCDTFTNLSQLKIKKYNRLIIIRPLNINSISGKFDQLKPLIEKNIEILILLENKN